MPDAAPDAEAQSRAGREARDWLVRLTSGEVSAEDLEKFRIWQAQSPGHARAFDRERSFWQQLQALNANAPAPATLQTALAASSLHAHRGLNRRAVLAGGLAAGVAGAMAAPRLIRWWHSDFATGVGEMADLALPDGSVVALNTDSAVSIRFTPDLRQVTLLRGEAEFRVSAAGDAPMAIAGPDTGLDVAALGGISRSAGGVFSVALHEGMVRVAVAQGQARVTSGGGSQTGWDSESVTLLPAQATSYGAGTAPLPASDIDPEMVFAWRNGRIILEGRRFDDAIRELGRYLPERIVLGPGVNPAIPVSAVFSTTAPRQAVDALAKTQGLSVHRIPHVMLLIS